MAKIYETKEDIARDQLSHHAEAQRLSKNILFFSGFGSLTTGLLSLKTDKIESLKLDAGHKGSFLHGLGKVVGWAGIVLGAVALTKSFFESRAEAKTRSQLKDLGPENVVIGEQSLAPAEEKDCVPCKLKHQKFLAAQRAEKASAEPATPAR